MPKHKELLLFCFCLSYLNSYQLIDPFISYYENIKETLEQNFNLNEHINKFLLPSYSDSPKKIPQSIKIEINETNDPDNARILSTKKSCIAGSQINVQKIHYWCYNKSAGKEYFNGTFSMKKSFYK